ncbi:metallophosphoesterase [Methylotuvimicrobium sp. KM2]|uniref:metallophosphoesterase n=1 Tax=Methylotuvimicrobium sp. KM2 TaxID=3133976 RepID=UPI0031017636
MKIFLISDIHTEFAHRRFDLSVDYRCLRFDYPDAADVVILAGDIGEGCNGLEWGRRRFANHEIIYVAGNHEFYDNDLSIIDELRATAEALGIHFLENDGVVIDGVRFLGCTLWTDFNRYSPAAVYDAQSTMTDYRYITCKTWWQNPGHYDRATSLMRRTTDSLFGFEPRYFSPAVAYCLHQDSLRWLDRQLAEAHDGKTVVVTHHAPSLRSMEIVDYAYASALDDFIADRSHRIDLWCHGHIHKLVDYEIAGVRIVSNPRGYPKSPAPGFDEGRLIEVVS